MNSNGYLFIGLAAWLIVINLITFIVFGIDKKRAIHHEWRIPEKTLFLLSIIGGSPGALFGMVIFHHKTKKWYFRIGMPLILAVQVATGFLIWKFVR